MKDGLIFANARAKAKELNLFTEERLHRMMESKAIDDAVRLLSEVNYAGGIPIDRDNFYQALIEEEKQATDFVKSCTPKGIGIECFFLRNDYHNLKALVKAKYSNISDISVMILPDGNYAFSELADRFENNKLAFVNSYMNDAVKNIEKAFETGNGTPRKIDTEIDKAMYREINDILSKKDVDEYIKQYFVTFIDATNIGTLLRTINIGANFAFFEENFIEGGELGLYAFRECGVDEQKLAKLVNGTSYKNFYAKISDGDMSGYETAKDEYLLNIFATNRGDMFSLAPIVGYYLAKLNEVKVLRVVLVCIKNNVPTEEMKKRVRALYA
ncbi:MAG: V-type ATPase subunit [Clostridia bacterium]|nr:V-type ATPase subunit [Clostridia bacterium]